MQHENDLKKSSSLKPEKQKKEKQGKKLLNIEDLRNNLNLEPFEHDSAEKYDFKTDKQVKSNIIKNNIENEEHYEKTFHDLTENIEKTTQERQIQKTKELNSFFLQIMQNKQIINAAKMFSQSDLLSLFSNKKLFQSPKNAEKFNFILTILRKHKPMKSYERTEIMNTLNFIHNNLEQLLPENISEYCVNLYNMKINHLEFYKRIEDYVLKNSYKFSLRGLANITHAFTFVSKNQNIMEDFQKMFRELETIIALKIRQNPEVDTKSINQIMIAYSKTMNFSKEFLYFLEQVCLENFDKFDPQETSNILYSFSKNRYESKGLLDKLEENFEKDYGIYKIKEVSLCLEVFGNSNRITEKISKIMKKIMRDRGNQFNIQDFAVFMKYLMINDAIDKETSKLSGQMFMEIYENIDQNCFAKLTSNFAKNVNENRLSKTFLKYWKKSLKHLIKGKKIRGRYLDLLRGENIKILDKKLKERINFLLLNYKSS